MRKHHKVFLGGFGTIVLIFMILTGIVLNGIIIKQSQENKNIREELSELKTSSESKINEIATTLINTREAIAKDISLINSDLTTANIEIGKIMASDYEDFSGLIEESKKSVVLIQTLAKQGTGFFVDTNGHIVTNAHVLKNENGNLLSLIQVLTIDGQIHSGTLLGIINELDLALIKIDSSIGPLEFEKSKNIQIGEQVIAIGSPEGLAFSVTDGIVSATKRVGFNGIAGYIQTNAELNEGNSGGPLINKEGKVIGITNFKVREAEGLGFALESDIALKGINEIGMAVYNQTII